MMSWVQPVSEADYRAIRCDADAWRHAVEDVLDRHDLREAGAEVVAGYNPTYPTFVVGDVVVKFFGFVPTWRMTHAAERAAMTLLLTDPLILAPRLLATGTLTEDAAHPWPYHVFTRIAGASLEDAELDGDRRMRVASEIGVQLRRIHGLRPSEACRAVAWEPVALTEALARSSLPPHLIEQAPDYVEAMPFAPSRFLHGDLGAQHVFVERGSLTGFVDWGDAVVADPHLELIQIYRGALLCDDALFVTFLDAYGWSVDASFAHRALGHALLRQALGLAQHLGMDVFEPISERWDLTRVPTLEAMASMLFGATGTTRA